MAERKLSRLSASYTWKRWANSTQTRASEMGDGRERRRDLSMRWRASNCRIIRQQV